MAEEMSLLSLSLFWSPHPIFLNIWALLKYIVKHCIVYIQGLREGAVFHRDPSVGGSYYLNLYSHII